MIAERGEDLLARSANRQIRWIGETHPCGSNFLFHSPFGQREDEDMSNVSHALDSHTGAAETRAVKLLLRIALTAAAICCVAPSRLLLSQENPTHSLQEQINELKQGQKRI